MNKEIVNAGGRLKDKQAAKMVKKKQINFEESQASLTERWSSSNRSNQLQGKKYPKSPCTVHNNRQLLSKPIVQRFDEGVETRDQKLKFRKSTHRKGKSMDFQIFGEPKFYYVEHKQGLIWKTRAGIDSDCMRDIRMRNTRSDLRDYPGVLRSRREVEKNGTKMRKKSKNDEGKAKKFKKQQNLRPKSKDDLVVQHSTSINSGHLMKYRGKSLQLISRKCKSSLRDGINKKSQAKKIDMVLPFPSKVNSLYSNTTSLFCSKTEFQPFTQSTTYRIPTEQPEQVFEIRQYESQALTRQSMQYQEGGLRAQIAQIDELKLDKQLQISTKQLINNYVALFEGEKMKHNKAGKGFLQGLMKRSTIKSYGFIQGGEESRQQVEAGQQSSKLNEVLKLISETEVLGQERRQLILAKIREIVPIACIGSKQLQRQKQERVPQNELNNSNNSDSGSSEEKGMYNIKALDKILIERQKKLLNVLEKELEEADKKQNNSKDQQKATDQLSLRIKQSMNVRAQLWKNFQVARQLLKKDALDGQSGELINDSEYLLGSRQQKMVTNFDCTSMRGDLIQTPNKGQVQNMETLKGSSGYQVNNIEDNLQLREFEYPGEFQRTLHRSKNIRYQEEVSASSDSKLKRHIFVDSAELIEYDYQDDSPEPRVQENLNNTKKLICEQSQEHHELSSHDEEWILLEHLSSEQTPAKRLTCFLGLSEGEKQDISEYIFIDLCLQLLEELDQDSKVYECIKTWINSARGKKVRPKGLNTDAFAVKQYMRMLLFYLRSDNDLLAEIYDQLERPLGPSALQILRCMRVSQGADSQYCLEIENVLGESVFQKFQKEYASQLKISRYFDDEQREKKRVLFLRNASRVHNKAIFDCFNEVLDKKRLFGQWGRPFKWKTGARFEHRFEDQQKNKFLVEAATEVIRFCQTACGFIVDKQGYDENNGLISEDYLRQRHNESLFTFLHDYVVMSL